MCAVCQTFVLLSMYRRIDSCFNWLKMSLPGRMIRLLAYLRLRNSVSENPPKCVTNVGHSSSEDYSPNELFDIYFAYVIGLGAHLYKDVNELLRI
jgi:hypothetical protein